MIKFDEQTIKKKKIQKKVIVLYLTLVIILSTEVN